MPVLPNAKHEHFAQLLAAGENVTRAYICAGYSENGAAQSGSRLLRDAEIATRVNELKEAAAFRHIEKAALTKTWVVEKLKLNVERALQEIPVLDGKGQPTGEYRYEGNVANRALELLGKELGMFSEKKPEDGKQSQPQPLFIEVPVDDDGEDSAQVSAGESLPQSGSVSQLGGGQAIRKDVSRVC